MTFAQNGEDSILERFFGNQRTGYFVEVGAVDGVSCSNTLLFERKGWAGMCIEPNPQVFPELVANRTRSVCIRAAIVGDPALTEATLYLSEIRELATLDRAHDAAIETIHQNINVPYSGLTPVTVPACTLDSLLEQKPPPKIDLLSIDTEWTNGDVLKGLTLPRWCPRVVIIEVGDGVQDGMARAGYHFVREYCSNLFYVRDESDSERMAAAFDAPSKVTALVSTYNAEKFIRGCLDDLLAQTLRTQNRLEIIVINSGSKQGEARILREYLARGVDIQVITSLREPMYAALNRGIRMATGDYVTICNTDDRHAPYALERLATALDDNIETGLVYADCYVTPTENAVWGGDYKLSAEAPYMTGRLNWPEFDARKLVEGYYLGPQPMWRRTLHAVVGAFDDNYIVAGDYEFGLRLVAAGITCQRVPEVLGLFYWNPTQQGRAMSDQSSYESRRAILQYRERINQTWPI